MSYENEFNNNEKDEFSSKDIPNTGDGDNTQPYNAGFAENDISNGATGSEIQSPDGAAYKSGENNFDNLSAQSENAQGSGFNTADALSGKPEQNSAGFGSEPYRASQNAQPQKESVGIRYDAEGGRRDGNYTWNYYGAGGSAMNQSAPKKSNKGYVAFLVAAMVLVIIGTAAISAVITANYIKTGRVTTITNTQSEVEKPVIGQKNEGESQEIVVTPTPEDAVQGALSKQAIAVKCKPSSVGIEVTSKSYSIYGYSYQTSGVGSGFILTEDGYVATNHHVIENADKITVQLDDGTKHEAVLIGSDSITDLAVLKIEASGLTPMEIGDSDKMSVGDSVIAIGTPAGIEFAGTVTDGIISAINRNIEITNERGAVVKTMTLMQTNAAINPGNSGGPLINVKGEVIGINTLKLTSSYEGIGFSIPINSAVKIFNQLISDGKVSEYDSSFVSGNGGIGITQYAEVSKQEAEYYGIPEGIIVIQIKNTSSAVSAGLRRGDIIIGFCGTDVKTVDELNKLKSKYKAGDEVTLRIYRDGEGERDITFKLDIMES